MMEDLFRFLAIFMVAFCWAFFSVSFWQYLFQKEIDRLKSYLPQDPFTPLPEPPNRNLSDFGQKTDVFINSINEIKKQRGFKK